ncbi:MAG: ligase-associated DNA damage response DEXH box helicase [Geminicoccaceae bacterium]|nr:ligase-associated DNA damage response DEXH box helicase [Geminicoccaceae bacterium]MDW8342068.1 ligase-associated DNA damage response DEXH box helicase [Geminicoccaceae bacterium]
MTDAPCAAHAPLDGLASLPARFVAWFSARGWRPRAHQLAMLALAREGRDALLVAPTGGGKTLAGFLPSLVELAREGGGYGIHTLYVSPLKALAADIARNLETPIREMGLSVRIAVRTGDTSPAQRARQRRRPPDILLTTPESLALMLSYPDAAERFRGLRAIVLDEVHALAESKRGALLALGVARLRSLAPDARIVGLSATVADPDALCRYLSPEPRSVALVRGEAGAPPEVEILIPDARMPWAGHYATHAAAAILELVRRHRTSIVFVNTRAQAEVLFGLLWRLNEDNLPIALHHGSLDAEQRHKVERAMARGGLRAVVATSSLDLGIDWGDVDLVVQVGAPKSVARLLQRIGRANHRLEEPSRAVLVPANRFEVLECLAAREALAEAALDGGAIVAGGLDVLAQHVTGVACAGPFDADRLYEEVRRAAPYAALARSDFDAVLDFVATGGYALGGYERYRRLVRGSDGLWRLADPRLACRYRMNIGTIVEAPVMHVRLGPRGRRLGEVEEYFVSTLAPGDTFLFAGRLLEFVGVREDEVVVRAAKRARDPKVPTYAGGKLPLTDTLATRVRRILATRERWPQLPAPVREWLEAQIRRSSAGEAEELLVETFPRRGRHFLVAYPFAGRNAHQTLGMLLTRRMERLRLAPLGFVASDYCIAVWGRVPIERPEELFTADLLADDLEEWMAESTVLRRAFRNCAVVAGLVERRLPGREKTGRQVTMSTDLLYDVLRKYEPDHVLLRAARAEAAQGMIDLGRLSDLLNAIQGRIRHERLSRISPFAVAIIAGIGKEFVGGEALDQELEAAVAELLAEAMA